MTTHRACPACGRDNADRPPIAPSVHPWVLKACDGCGFVYLENPPVYARFADEFAWETTCQTERARRQREEPVLQWIGRRLIDARRLLPRRGLLELTDRLVPDGDVLDVGREAVRVLRQDGVLILKVPNHASLNRRVRRARWCGFRFPDHVNYFTPASLKSMVRAAGLRVVRMNISDRLPTSDNMWLVAGPSAH